MLEFRTPCLPLHRRAFTLVELLVVITILGALAAISIPVIGNVRTAAHRAQCASNMRQIGIALLAYASEHGGKLPPTTHSTAVMANGRYESWIYKLAPYLGDADAVRICPADNPARQQRIRETDGLTSYSLNDIVFDPEDGTPAYNRVNLIPHPGRTKLLFNVSDDRQVRRGWDHARDRLKGSANYLFADAHVQNIEARKIKALLNAGINPGAVPL